MVTSNKYLIDSNVIHERLWFACFAAISIVLRLPKYLNVSDIQFMEVTIVRANHRARVNTSYITCDRTNFIVAVTSNIIYSFLEQKDHDWFRGLVAWRTQGLSSEMVCYSATPQKTKRLKRSLTPTWHLTSATGSESRPVEKIRREAHGLMLWATVDEYVIYL